MKAGEVIEQGTHNSLVAANGAYKKLVARQMKKEEISNIDQALKD